MHYHAEVYLKEITNLEKQIETILSPYEEGKSEDGFWDWWQIGGRWKGCHVKGYDQEADPDHKEKCNLCDGTGTRTDMKAPNGCNGCHGTGIATKRPTKWQPHKLDAVPIFGIHDDLNCYTLIIPTKIYHIETWNGRNFVKTEFNGKVKPVLEKHGIKQGFLVTIDYLR
jgi:hypothetical protein